MELCSPRRRCWRAPKIRNQVRSLHQSPRPRPDPVRFQVHPHRLPVDLRPPSERAHVPPRGLVEGGEEESVVLLLRLAVGEVRPDGAPGAAFARGGLLRGGAVPIADVGSEIDNSSCGEPQYSPGQPGDTISAEDLDQLTVQRQVQEGYEAAFQELTQPAAIAQRQQQEQVIGLVEGIPGPGTALGIAAAVDPSSDATLGARALHLGNAVGSVLPLLGDGAAIAGTWGNDATLADHFLRHGADFGSTSANAYSQQASQFLLDSQAQGFPTKIDASGVIRVYDPGTNAFGSYNANGTTRTFFTPDPAAHGYPTNLDYWNAQPGVAPWTPSP